MMQTVAQLSLLHIALLEGRFWASGSNMLVLFDRSNRYCLSYVQSSIDTSLVIQLKVKKDVDRTRKALKIADTKWIVVEC